MSAEYNQADYVYICPRCLEDGTLKQVDVYENNKMLNVLCPVHEHFTILGKASQLSFSAVSKDAGKNLQAAALLFAQTTWLKWAVKFVQWKNRHSS